MIYFTVNNNYDNNDGNDSDDNDNDDNDNFISLLNESF